MLEYLTLYEFVVALLMAAVGACAFLWAAAVGLWRDVEAAKHQVMAAEDDMDG